MKKVKGSFLFKIKGDAGNTEEWLVDLKSGKGSVTKSPGNLYNIILCRYAAAECIIMISVTQELRQSQQLALSFI